MRRCSDITNINSGHVVDTGVRSGIDGISRFVSWSFVPEKGSLYAKGGKLVNPKKIGTFLKQLRNEKRVTQEQMAEILGVSGRTVSRWETGSNLPDLSILVQISEYYDVEIKEILNGERKSENINSELKETLLKVADYNELERQRAAKAGALSFRIMFLVCALTIIIQMFMEGSFSLIIGETVVLVVGGLIYIFITVKNGAWNGTRIKSTPKNDLMISLLCVAIFSIAFYLFIRKHVAVLQAFGTAVCFFAVLSALSYVLQRGLSKLSQRKSDKLKDENHKFDDVQKGR